jgi:hypothetical protein
MNEPDQNSAVAAEPAKVILKEPVPTSRMRMAQEVRNLHRLVVANDEQYEDLRNGDPRAWQILGDRVAGGDTIEVVDDASTRFALWYVRMAIGRAGHVEIAVILEREIGEAASTEPHKGDGWYVMFRGPHAKWCAIRPDGTIDREGFLTRESAQQYCNERVPLKQKGFAVNY